VTARGRVLVQQRLRTLGELTVLETSRRGHATRFAQGAAARGVDLVVSFGGDGTLNETANGLVGSTTALAPLPGGSTNVMAQIVGYPNDPVAAAGVIVERITAGPPPEPVGVGSVNGRTFLFHTGVGFDAAVVEAVERQGDLKRFAGHVLFAWTAARTALAGRRAPRFTVSVGTGPHPVDASAEGVAFAIVLNANPYTFLGSRPFDVAPEATLDRALSVVCFRGLSPVALARAALAALRGGGIASGPGVDHWADVTVATVSAAEAVPYQVDGDHLGDSERLTFRHHPAALRLVVP
jgi:diacylglycerol kinase family enzyme